MSQRTSGRARLAGRTGSRSEAHFASEAGIDLEALQRQEEVGSSLPDDGADVSVPTSSTLSSADAQDSSLPPPVLAGTSQLESGLILDAPSQVVSSPIGRSSRLPRAAAARSRQRATKAPTPLPEPSEDEAEYDDQSGPVSTPKRSSRTRPSSDRRPLKRGKPVVGDEADASGPGAGGKSLEEEGADQESDEMDATPRGRRADAGRGRSLGRSKAAGTRTREKSATHAETDDFPHHPADQKVFEEFQASTGADNGSESEEEAPLKKRRGSRGRGGGSRGGRARAGQGRHSKRGAVSAGADEDEEEGLHEGGDAEEDKVSDAGETDLVPVDSRSRFMLVSEFGQTTLVPAVKRVKGTATSFSLATKDDARGGMGRGKGYRYSKRGGRRARGGAGGSATPNDSPAPGKFKMTGGAREDIEGSHDEDDAQNDAAGVDASEDESQMVDVPQVAWVQGREYTFVADELQLDEDEEGEKKIDIHGNLLGGREWRIATFTSSTRSDPQRRYCLAVDAARACGFKDSLYFFRRTPLLVRLFLTHKEREELVDAGRIDPKLKGRKIAVVAARNVFKVFGRACVRYGRSVVDDYYEAAAKEAGATDEGQMGGAVIGAVRESGGRVARATDDGAAASNTASMRYKEKPRDREAEKLRNLARQLRESHEHSTMDPFTAEPVRTLFGDSGSTPFVRADDRQRQKAILSNASVTSENWMLMMARSTQAMNGELYAGRKERLVNFVRPEEALGDFEEIDRLQKRIDSNAPHAGSVTQKLARPVGVYEPATNVVHVAQDTQPRWATIEKVSGRPDFAMQPKAHAQPILGGARAGSNAWGLATFTTSMHQPAAAPQEVRIPSGSENSGARSPSQMQE
ncbi:POLYCOMB GROUP PROTEIN [Ceraceosorus bombacis]|uniref:POLYCOMB GROUP PROTEIN n=1 Tax=Ceraceosorus bombacis TaxID=401625 RepID=A0A0P1BEF4_9BASI|nr:POLYCOMB GROUP PROTEIN [Ceraceosorus bombacis]